jgi:hypothetical protein
VPRFEPVTSYREDKLQKLPSQPTSSVKQTNMLKRILLPCHGAESSGSATTRMSDRASLVLRVAGLCGAGVLLSD